MQRVCQGRAVLDGVQILSNRAAYGGGAYVGSVGVFTQTGTSLIAYNTASDSGGGIKAEGGYTFLEGGQINQNIANYGGGLYVDYGQAILRMTAEIVNNGAL